MYLLHFHLRDTFATFSLQSWENNLVFYGINIMKDEEHNPDLITGRVSTSPIYLILSQKKTKWQKIQREKIEWCMYLVRWGRYWKSAWVSPAMCLFWGWSGHIQVQDQWSCSFVHVFIPFFCLFIYMMFGANLETPVTEKSVWVFLILFYFFLTVIPICLFWFAQSSLRRFLTTLVWAGSNVRGAKPVTVYFGKYEDKEEVLRQVNQMCKPNLEMISF